MTLHPDAAVGPPALVVRRLRTVGFLGGPLVAGDGWLCCGSAGARRGGRGSALHGLFEWEVWVGAEGSVATSGRVGWGNFMGSGGSRCV